MEKKPRKKRTTKKKSEGLGDTIEKITEATGIKAAVKWLAVTIADVKNVNKS
jgi:hypothetical protein